MTTLRIMSWNIKGLENHIPIIDNLLNDNNIDIAGFQEVQCLQTVEDTLNNATPSYHTSISTKDQGRDAIERLKCANKRQHFGTSITCRKENEKNLNIIKQKNYNIKAARYKIGESKILILSIYIPTSGKEDKFEKMCDELGDIICREAVDSTVIEFRDLNIRPRNKKWRKCYKN